MFDGKLANKDDALLGRELQADSNESEVALGLQCAIVGPALLKAHWRQHSRMALLFTIFPLSIGAWVYGDPSLTLLQTIGLLAGSVLITLSPFGVHLWERRRIRIGRFGELDFEEAEMARLELSQE